MSDHIGQSRKLFTVHKLLHIAHIHGLSIDGKSVQPHGFHFDPVVLGKSLVRLDNPVKIRFLRRRGIPQRIGELLRLLFGQRRDLHRAVLVHL